MVFSDKKKGTQKVSLGELAKHNEHTATVGYSKKKYQFEIKFEIRTALKVKEEEKVPTKNLVIDGFPKPFKDVQKEEIKVARGKINIDTNMEEEQKVPTQSKQRKTQQPQKQRGPAQQKPQEQPQKKPALAKQQTTSEDPPLPETLTDIPQGIREIDVRDPDDIGNLIRYPFQIIVLVILFWNKRSNSLWRILREFRILAKRSQRR